MDTVEYEWVTFENEFLTASTKYRGKPTPELEQAWKALYHCETIQLTVILAMI
jgi:Mycotoxin biosynthesis protein UstYa